MDPPDSWWIEQALARIGRPSSQIEVDRLVQQLRVAGSREEIDALRGSEDSDARLHRELHFRLCALAGLDHELAESLYQLDFQPDSHPFYSDVPDVLQALHAAGVRIGIVGNVHFDLRPEFVHAGLSDYVDTFVLSYEHGMQKPDPRMFELALETLGTSPSRALMVGDRPGVDGGAVAIGVTSITLPSLREIADRGLRMVTRLLGIENS